MTDTIDYFYSHVSPYAYLGHAAFLDMAARHGVTVRFRPVNLGEVFAETGGLPLGQRHPARQQYRWLELQRWALKRGLPFNFKPAFFPAAPGLADCVAIALIEAGKSPAAFGRLMLAGCWAEERNIADESFIREALSKLGEDTDALIAAAKSDPITAIYAQNVKDAIALNAFGSPCFVRDGESFWGQDRLDLLEDAIVSGRPGFRPL